MEAVIIIEFLMGRLMYMALLSKNVIHTHHFESPYTQYFYADSANVLTWEDRFLNYDQIYTVLSESISYFGRVYCYGTETLHFLEKILQIPIHDLHSLYCPDPHKINFDYRCYLFVTKIFPMLIAQQDTRMPYTDG